MDITLIITKQIADEILSGRKRCEYRDFSNFYMSKFLTPSAEGEGIPIEDKWYNFKEAEAIRFQIGYSKKCFRVKLNEMFFTQKQCLSEIGDDLKAACNYDESRSFKENVERDFDISQAPDDYAFFILSLGEVIDTNV